MQGICLFPCVHLFVYKKSTLSRIAYSIDIVKVTSSTYVHHKYKWSKNDTKTIICKEVAQTVRRIYA